MGGSGFGWFGRVPASALVFSTLGGGLLRCGGSVVRGEGEVMSYFLFSLLLLNLDVLAEPGETFEDTWGNFVSFAVLVVVLIFLEPQSYLLR
jgi:hypothetical protein